MHSYIKNCSILRHVSWPCAFLHKGHGLLNFSRLMQVIQGHSPFKQLVNRYIKLSIRSNVFSYLYVCKHRDGQVIHA